MHVIIKYFSEHPEVVYSGIGPCLFALVIGFIGFICKSFFNKWKKNKTSQDIIKDKLTEGYGLVKKKIF